MAYTTIDDPTAYFQTVIYTGNATARAITFDGNTDMQPDWVWGKQRSGTDSHQVSDSVRGATKKLNPDTTAAEDTTSTHVTAFNSNGFSVGTGGGYNGNTIAQVAWSWKAGTSFTNDASATGIGNIDSAGSVSTAAGFSIISYTGNANADNTVAHGLGSVPKMIILKNRSISSNWMVYHVSTGAQAPLFLNLTNAAGSGDPDRFKVVPTSSVFTPGSAQEGNGSGNSIIAYCFAEKQGYSKFGSYTGNGSASSGTFIYTGQKSAFIMIKRTDTTGSWEMYDAKREGFNPQVHALYANGTNAEDNTDDLLDLLSNGFKLYHDGGGLNASGGTYIYMAFAENPFVTSTGVPACAR